MDISRTFSTPSEETMRAELQALSRKDLQALAKQEGVKANMSSTAIIDELLRLSSATSVLVQPVKDVMPVVRASGSATVTATPGTIMHGKPLPSRPNATTWPCIIGKPATAVDRPNASRASSSSSGSRPDSAGVPDRDQTGVAAADAAGAARAQPPTSVRASADVARTSASAARSNRRKRWQVPAAPVGSEQQLQQQMGHLNMGATTGANQQARPAPGGRVSSSSVPPSMQVAASGTISATGQLQPTAPSSRPLSAAAQQWQSVLPEQQHEKQKQLYAAPQPSAGGMMLHTPLRVRAQGPSSTAAAAGAAGPQAVQDQPARAPAATAAATPTKQRVKAFGAGLANGVAAAAPAATDAPAGLLSPKLAVMGSARRVVPTQTRLAPAASQHAAAAAGVRPQTVQGTTMSAAEASNLRPGSAGIAATAAAGGGPPPTPLQKGARRAVPADSDQQPPEEDRSLEAIVERCIRIRTPDAPQTVLQGPEPAKRWLQQHIITPLNQAAPAAAGAPRSSATSSSKSSTCLAAGFCHRGILLYGPSGSGKTELVHALAAGMGANLLYVPAGDVLKTYQEQGHRLLRALFKVAQRSSPSVICFDDAHRSFPADARLANPSHPSHNMLVELTVQMQQLSDMQAQLQEKCQLGVSSNGHATSSSNSSNGRLLSPQRKGGKKPAWGGIFSKQKQQQDALQEQRQQQAQQRLKPQLPAYQQLPGPVVVVFATRHPEALEPALLHVLPQRLLLDLPSCDSREDLLMAWLMAREAAVSVPDVELLARRTEGFSCTDLLQLCHEAAMRPVQERSRRAISMRDFEAAFQRVKPSVSPMRRMQLKGWQSP